RIGVAEFGAENVVGRNNSLEGGLDHFNRCRREDVEFETISFNSPGEDFIQQVDVLLQANQLAHLIEMLAPYPAAEFRIVKQQVGKLRALLDQVELRHAARFALEFFRGNSDQLT